MSTGTSRLTVYFEEPFWVGVFERLENGRLSAAKVTFGAEPRDREIYELILRQYHALTFGPVVPAVEKASSRNPKRVQREIRRQLQDHGVGTKSQQALKLQHEQNKQLGQASRRARREAEAERRFALKQQKKKARHRGR